jgi:hypothetical protein
MTIHSSLRRALLLVAAGAGVAACDLAEFVADPKPRFEQTWNLPAPSQAISVASLLPPNDVEILPDSSAFTITMGGANVNAVVGDHCAACVALNGTSAPKPAFTFTVANSTALPPDVVSAAITDGQVDIQLVNNMSFDPLFVRTAPGPQTQGYLAITIRSGSVVLGVDTVKGETTQWPPAPAAGSTLNRSIPLATGTITGTITVEVTLNSPSGDHNEFIDANGQLNAAASVPSLEVASVTVDIPNRQLDPIGEPLDLSDMDDVSEFVVGGELRMTIDNPFAVTGTVDARFVYGPAPSQVIVKSFSLPTGTDQVRSVVFDSTDMANLFGNEVQFEMSGGVNSTAPITITPTQAIHIDNRMILTVRTKE